MKNYFSEYNFYTPTTQSSDIYHRNMVAYGLTVFYPEESYRIVTNQSGKVIKVKVEKRTLQERLKRTLKNIKIKICQCLKRKRKNKLP